MLRVSLFLSTFLHLTLMGVVSLLVLQASPEVAPTEKRFQVQLRNSTSGPASSAPDRSPAESRPVHAQPPQLPFSREIIRDAPKVPKLQRAIPEIPVYSIAQSRTPEKEKTALPRPKREKGPKIRDAVLEARQLPTPVPKKTHAPPRQRTQPKLTPTPIPTVPVPTPLPVSTPQPSPAQPIKQAVAKIVPPDVPDSSSTVTSDAAVVARLPINARPSGSARNVQGSMVDEEKNLIDSYLQGVAARINTKKSYPRRARKKGWQGTVVIRLEIVPSGTVKKAEVVESSGYKTLDKAALQAIQKAQPFSHFDERLRQQSLIVKIPLQFLLKKR